MKTQREATGLQGRKMLIYMVLVLIFSNVAMAGPVEKKEVMAGSFLLNLSGSINIQHKIQMVVYNEGTSLAGSYVYTKVGKPLALKGTMDAERHIILNESDDKGTPTGIFKGTLTQDGKIEGTWSTPDGSKTMPFIVEPFEINGCYVHNFRVPVFDGKDWVDSDAGNGLIFQREGGQQLKFSLGTVGTNAHLCTAEGVATRVGDVYEYRPEDCPTCHLRIIIKPDRIVIEDPDSICRGECGFCGARAALDSEFMFSEKLKDTTEYMKNYEGELFKDGKNTE